MLGIGTVRSNQRPEEVQASRGSFSLNCLISWLEVEINSSGVFVVWQDGKQKESCRAGGEGPGRGVDPESPWNPRKGWAGVCDRNRRPERNVLTPSCHRHCTGCSEGQGTPNAQSPKVSFWGHSRSCHSEIPLASFTVPQLDWEPLGLPQEVLSHQ